jgi:hypothetical protein
VPSEAARKKASSRRTEANLPLQTFGGLIEDLGTLVKNVMQAGKDESARFSISTTSTPFQKKALELLRVGANL